MAKKITQEEKEKLKISIRYQFDSFLMYLIQDMTKKSSAEIVNFFHELAQQVGTIGYQKMTGRGIDKQISDFFPKTSIPFFMRLKGHVEREWNRTTGKYDNADIFACYADITFPESPTYMKQEELDNVATELMEKALLGVEASDMPPFKKPHIKTPDMFRKLMDSFTDESHTKPKKPKKKEDIDEGD